MCLSIPGKIKSAKKGFFEIDYGFEKRTVKKSLIKIKAGDYVLVQNQMIIKKIPQKQAIETLKLINQ